MGSPSPTSTYAIVRPRTRRRCFRYGSAAEIMAALFAAAAALSTVVELAVLTDEEGASVRRDALRYVGLASLLEVVGASRQRYISTVRSLVDHGARDHDRPVVLGMRVGGAHV